MAAPTPIAASRLPNPRDPTPRCRWARITNSPLVAPADNEARICTTARRRSSGLARTALTPASAPAQSVTSTDAGPRPSRSPRSRSAETTKVAALSANAARTPPPVAMTNPAAGASAIWAMTATLHRALFAVIKSA